MNLLFHDYLILFQKNKTWEEFCRYSIIAKLLLNFFAKANPASNDLSVCIGVIIVTVVFEQFFLSYLKNSI